MLCFGTKYKSVFTVYIFRIINCMLCMYVICLFDMIIMLLQIYLNKLLFNLILYLLCALLKFSKPFYGF